MTCLRLIADDLTGALDSAAQFTGSIGSLPVVTAPGVALPDGSFVLNLSCRDGTSENAVALTRATMQSFVGADIAFKKIDSLLRGYWAWELAAILDANLFQRMILAPAFPAQGRFTIGGKQIVVQQGGTFESIGDPMAALVPFGYGAHTAPTTDRTAILLPDVRSDADLKAIVALYRDMPGTLWCGAAGLAQALAGAPALPVRTGNTPHLVLVGSRHPVTLGQIARFSEVVGAPIVRFGSDDSASATAVQSQLDVGGACVAVPDLPSGLSPSEAAELIDTRIAALTQHLPAPARLTIVGGETIAALCRHLGTTTLTVEGECEPGIPASKMLTGRWGGTLCFSKSGAFGDPDWLVRQTADARLSMPMPRRRY